MGRCSLECRLHATKGILWPNDCVCEVFAGFLAESVKNILNCTFIKYNNIYVDNKTDFIKFIVSCMQLAYSFRMR